MFLIEGAVFVLAFPSSFQRLGFIFVNELSNTNRLVKFFVRKLWTNLFTVFFSLFFVDSILLCAVADFYLVFRLSNINLFDINCSDCLVFSQLYRFSTYLSFWKVFPVKVKSELMFPVFHHALHSLHNQAKSQLYYPPHAFGMQTYISLTLWKQTKKGKEEKTIHHTLKWKTEWEKLWTRMRNRMHNIDRWRFTFEWKGGKNQ